MPYKRFSLLGSTFSIPKFPLISEISSFSTPTRYYVQCFKPVIGRARGRVALALATYINEKPPQAEREGFGSSPACERRYFVHLLRFLFAWRSGRGTAYAMAVHHAGCHRFHVLLHSVHVGNHRFPHIHVVSPA